MGGNSGSCFILVQNSSAFATVADYSSLQFPDTVILRIIEIIIIVMTMIFINFQDLVSRGNFRDIHDG